MGWFNKFKDEFMTNLRKEWNMSETTQSAVTVVAATPATVPVSQDVSAETPSVTPTTTEIISGTVRTDLAIVSTDFQNAVTDLETFIESKEKYIESFIATELANLRAKAEAEFNDVVKGKKSNLLALETELNVAKSWISDKFHSLIDKL